MSTAAKTITTEEAAQLLGLSPKAVRRLCHLGRLPGIRDGKRWKLYLPALLANLRDQARHPLLPQKGTSGGRPRLRIEPPTQEAIDELIANRR